MVELRGDTGVQMSLTNYRIQRQSFVKKGRRRRGRPRLRWEDYAKRDVRKAGEEEYWKKNTRDKGWWKRLSDNAVKKLRAAPRPMTKGKLRDISLLLI